MLDLDEALAHEQVAARQMVLELDQPGIGAVKQVGFPIELSRTPASVTRPAPALGEQTQEVLEELGYDADGIERLRAQGVGVSAPASSSGELLRMRELADAAGVSAGTIKHYLREGLLPDPVKTSRNMAWYPREFVERVKLIKQLQEERYLPLKVIKEVLEQGDDDGGSARLRALIELEDRILERALSGQDGRGLSARQVRQRYGLPQEALVRLEQLEILTPRVHNGGKRYGPDDVQIIEAVSRMRASGYSEALGFTVYDTMIYKRNLERLVREEVEVMMERVAGEMDTDQATELIERAVEPMRDLLAALRAKLLIAELKARRAAQR